LRLHHYLARAGIASRRAAEELIVAGEVRVNGAVVTRLGTQIAQGDRVEFRGRVVRPVEEFTSLVLHKPAGVVTTMRDPEGRRTVAELIAEGGVEARVVPVGRLDYDTSGVLLLTDDGDLAHALTHPRFGVAKTYRATVRGRIGPEELARLRDGIRLDGEQTAPARLRAVAIRKERSTIDITLHEGRNRQVRRMFESVGHPVVTLVRTQFGPLALGALGPGRTRPPNAREARELDEIKRTAAGPAS
jgi:pseudouridine synthase